MSDFENLKFIEKGERFVNKEGHWFNPGSSQAVKAGCTCPIWDNNHGQGFGKPVCYWVDEECPLHGKLSKEKRRWE